MIITKEITLKVNPKTLTHYKKLGYNINGCEIITVPVEHLPIGSKILVLVKCDICGKEKELSYKSYNSNVSKYPIYACCEKCANKKRELTCLDKYGVKYNKDRKEFKEKSDLTKLEKYGDINYTNRNKYKETCLEKYGCLNSFQVEEFKQKSNETKLEKYGNETFTNPEKTIKTKIEKYNDPYFNNKEKAKMTNIEKYGVPSIFYLPEFIKNNSLLTKKRFENNPEKRKELSLWMSSSEFREKSINTCIERYGVRSPMQVESIVMKNHISGMWLKKFRDTNLYYRGTYELDFLETYYDKIKIESLKGGIKYELNGIYHYYYCDFYLPDYNLIIEIKSDYTFNLDLEKNLMKEKYSLKLGYNFLFLIDKDYTELDKLII